jgi:hypothetical protein
MKLGGAFSVVTYLLKFYNIMVFWDISPCGPVKVNRYFGGLFRLQLQALLAARCSLAWFILRP